MLYVNGIHSIIRTPYECRTWPYWYVNTLLMCFTVARDDYCAFYYECMFMHFEYARFIQTALVIDVDFIYIERNIR